MGHIESNTCAGEGASVEGLPSSACWRGAGPRWPAAGCVGPRSVASPPHSDAPRWHWGGPSDTWCGSEFDWRTSPNTPAACPHLEPTSSPCVTLNRKDRQAVMSKILYTRIAQSF